MTLVRRVLLLSLALVLLPAPASADPPARLATQVTDEAGVLTGRGAVDQALGSLRQRTGVQLFVVFVDSFDGVPAQEWTDRTAQLSDLGDRDALLAVATTDRAYAYSFPPDPRISDAELARVAERDIEPALASGDWSGAVVAAAGGYSEAAGGGSSYAWIFVVLAAVILGALLWVFLRRRRRARTPAPAPAPAGPSTQELTTQANALLLELDDDLRSSESELAMATAQYGEAETARFRAALEASRRDVAEAFRLRMTLDEEPGPDEETRHRTLTEIIARCRTADERLDAESEAFDQLRDLEGRAAEVATEVDGRRAAVEASLAGAAQAVTDLTGRFAGQTVTAVSGNVDQARERLRFTAEAVSRARAALADPSAEGGRAQAALAVRAAEQAVQQAEQLMTAVHRAAADLESARSAAGALITELEAEIAAGRGADGSAELQAAVIGAEQTVADVRARLAADKPDPVAAVAALQAADATLDRALAAARDAAERNARAHALLAQALPVARAEVAAATDFITTRRGAVGTGARASLSEAHRHLALAEGLAESDPVRAVAEAQQAQQHAVAAGNAAHTDVQSWGGYGSGGGYGPAGFDPGAFAGAVLGGILVGGGRSGGWGGGGGFGGGGFGGGFGGGGFGGSASRSRRGGGGRF